MRGLVERNIHLELTEFDLAELLQSGAVTCFDPVGASRGDGLPVDVYTVSSEFGDVFGDALRDLLIGLTATGTPMFGSPAWGLLVVSVLRPGDHVVLVDDTAGHKWNATVQSVDPRGVRISEHHTMRPIVAITHAGIGPLLPLPNQD